MALLTSLTGSYPPIHSPEEFYVHSNLEEEERDVSRGIERAIQDQIEIGIDVLVDGQVRDDIVSLFTCKIPGYGIGFSPNRIVSRIHLPEEPITVDDYLYAKKLAEGRPLKAHVTGPMTMARGSKIDPSAPYKGLNDMGLLSDLANVLGQEARWLVQSGAEIVQIDEPVLQDGVNLDSAFDAMRKIVEIGEIPIPALHICGNVTQILEEVLTKAPVKIISMEGRWLNEEQLAHIDQNYLARKGKQIGLGCIRVSDFTLDRLTKVQNFLDQMVSRLGEGGIWAVMPNCGLRMVPYERAKEKLKIMVKAAQSI